MDDLRFVRLAKKEKDHKNDSAAKQGGGVLCKRIDGYIE